MAKQKNAMFEILAQRKYNPKLKIEIPKPVLLINGITVATEQNIVTVTGLPKAGKSTYMAGLVASSIQHIETYGMRLMRTTSRNRIAYFDTEQSDYHCDKWVKQKLLTLTDKESLPEYIDMFRCREDEPTTIIEMIETYLHAKAKVCRIIIIDGLIDLVNSVNDEVECNRLKHRIRAWTKRYNIVIIAVLHTSKNASQNTVGHLGSIMDRLSEAVILVEKEKENNRYRLSAKMTRNGDFPDVVISYDKETNKFTQVENEKGAVIKEIDTPTRVPAWQHKKWIDAVYGEDEEMQNDTIVKLLTHIAAKGRNWCRDCFKHWIDINLLTKVNNKGIYKKSLETFPSSLGKQGVKAY